MKDNRNREKRKRPANSGTRGQTDGGAAVHPIAQRLDQVSLALLALMMFVVPLALSFRTTVVGGPIKYLIVRLMMFAVFSLWLFSQAFESRFQLRMPRLNVPVVVYAVLCIAASVVARNPSGSLVVLHDLLWCIAIYVVVANGSFNERSFTTVLAAMACAAFIAAVFGVLQRFNLAFNEWSAPEGEPIGTPSSFGHRNFAAEYMVACFPFVAALFWRVRSNTWKAAILVALLTILFHLFLAGSRASLIGLFAAISFFLLVVLASPSSASGRPRVSALLDACRKSLRRWEVRVLAVCALVFLAIGPFVLRSDFKEFIRDARTTFSLQRESNIVRVATWQSSAELALAHPVLGVGAGNYEVFLPEHWNMVDKERFAEKNRVSRLAHNAYLQIACETGFIGLAAFTWVIATAFVVGLGVVRRSYASQTNWLVVAALCSVVGALVNGFFAFNLSNPATRVLFWFALGCVGAAEKRSSVQPLADRERVRERSVQTGDR
jgi:O-antigen ligase